MLRGKECDVPPNIKEHEPVKNASIFNAAYSHLETGEAMIQ
jgi:hypothetical protein